MPDWSKFTKITATTVAGKTTITEYTRADTAVIVDKYGKAAKYLFLKGRGNHGTEEEPRFFSDLSNQEKLQIVTEWRIEGVYNMAATQVADEADVNKFAAVDAENSIEMDDVSKGLNK